MKQLSVLALSVFLGLFLSMSIIPDAEAKRLGGGKSFGSKPSQSQSAKRNDTNGAKSPAQQQNAAQKAAMSKKGGMMGLLGGLMIGGLLGALFFGGAFENINFMDILLFGLIAFVLYKIFASRKQHMAPGSATVNGAPIQADPAGDADFQQRQSANIIGGGTSEQSLEEPQNILQTGKIPRNFDQKRFLDGAESVYKLLQEAWDKGELGDLREFCSDRVFAELQDQFRERTGENRTEIIALKAELVNVVKSGNTTEATVVFNAELKEYDEIHGGNVETSKVQEAWYFLRPNNKMEHSWLLDAIQQIED